MTIYLASGNAHKVQEFQALADAATRAGGRVITFVSAKAVGGMPPVVEDTGTFIGNARKKAQALQAVLPADAWVLADDSGLCVDALGGAPGVESAYYAGPQGDSAANLRKLVAVMKEVAAGENADASHGSAGGPPSSGDRNAGEPPALPAYAAHFVCVLVLRGPEGVEQVFEGRCDGRLLAEPRGGAGFGYDPLFIPEGETRSLAEMAEEEKNRISHRGRAAAALFAWMRMKREG